MAEILSADKEMIPFNKTVKFASVEIQKAERLAPEVEEGNREYKFKLTDLTDDQLTHRITQLNWRLNEGNDEAFYLIGVEDNGNQLGLNESDLQESLRNLQFIADQVGCEMTVRQLFAGEQGTTAEVHMRRKQRITVDVVQVNVAVAGDLNSGKSTMIGVLSTGRLDNGKGLARMQVLTHNHEMESGTTSCISHHSLHFNKDGEVLNADPLPGMGKGNRLRTLSDMELADETSRSVTLIDLAGHAKYLKTTLHGLIGRRPDLCIVCVSATTGLNSITTEHLGVCMYLNVPLVIVITKEDCVARATFVKPKAKAKAAAKARNSYGTTEATSNDESISNAVPAEDSITSGTADAISRLVASVQEVLAGSQRQSKLITNDAELVQHLLQTGESSTNMSGATTGSTSAPFKATVPIFTVSNVTGKGMQLLRSFLFQLPAHAKPQRTSAEQATVVRLLGSIGTTNEREDVVFPRDEDEFSFKKPVRTRQYSLRYTPTDHEGTAQNHKENGVCLKTTSTSDDNLVAKEALHSTPASVATGAGAGAALIRRPHSSPDLPSTATHPPAQHSGEKATKASNTPEFSEYIETVSTHNTGGSGTDSGLSSCRDSPTSQAGATSVTSAGSNGRTKVLIGSIEGGKLSVGQALLLGPTCKGAFVSVTVSSLRLNNVPVCCASAGQTVTFKLSEGPATAMTAAPAATTSENIDDAGEFKLHSSSWLNEGRRRSSAAGLVLLSADAGSGGGVAPQAHWEFEAELLVLNHPAKIRANYEPVVHVGCVRQAARLISVRKMDKAGKVSNWREAGHTDGSVSGNGGKEDMGGEELGNGERGLCRFRFLYYPEFIIPGEAMIIREQRTRGMGTITKLLS